MIYTQTKHVLRAENIYFFTCKGTEVSSAHVQLEE